VAVAAQLKSAANVTETGPFVVFQECVYTLIEGANLLGRDPTAHVVVDKPGVSRLHARIVVSGSEAAIEDLGSKNGTFVAERRVDGLQSLSDLDSVRLGRTVLVYRSPLRPAATKTEAP